MFGNGDIGLGPNSDRGEALLSCSFDVQNVDSLRYGTKHCPRSESDEFVMLREMHHRLANWMVILSSMLRREFASSELSQLPDSVHRYEARICAFANLNRCLAVGAEPGRISIQWYIEQLCEALAEALLKPIGVRCEVHVDEGVLPSERCELLGLVIAELLTNSAKHAFQGRDAGLVRVEIANAGDRWVCTVSDNGLGMEAASAGVGSRIIGSLLRALDAKLVRRSSPGGTSVAIVVPATGEPQAGLLE
jgi:two-component sensor histidine kinase